MTRGVKIDDVVSVSLCLIESLGPFLLHQSRRDNNGDLGWLVDWLVTVYVRLLMKRAIM